MIDTKLFGMVLFVETVASALISTQIVLAADVIHCDVDLDEAVEAENATER